MSNTVATKYPLRNAILATKNLSLHPFRDLVAYTWQRKLPKRSLSLPKMLWHSDFNLTLWINGSCFHAACSVSALNFCLDKRSPISKQLGSFGSPLPLQSKRFTTKSPSIRVPHV
jgi:hypothetical protein